MASWQFSDSWDERELEKSTESWSSLPGHNKSLDLVFFLSGKSKLRSHGISISQPCCAEGAQFIQSFVAAQLYQTFAKFQHLLYPSSPPLVTFRISQF